MNAQYVKLSMIPSGVMPTLYVSQYDVGRPLGLIVTNGTELVDMDSYSVTIEATRSDGTQITAAVTTADNIGTFQTTATMTNVAGIYKAQLVIAIASGKRIASIPFLMNVTAAAMDENGQGIAEDQSLYQQYTGTVQTLIATIRADLNTEIANRQSAVSAEAAARQTSDNTLQSNINAEASARSTADASLQSQIDQLIAPSGSAPSAAEVENARVGADGTVYDTLGNAIRGQVSDLQSQLLKKVTPSSVADGYIGANGNVGTSTTYVCTDFVELPFLPGTKINVRASLVGSNSTVIYAADKSTVLFYINGNNCADYGYTAGSAPQNFTITLPDGSAYVRATMRNTYYSALGDFNIYGVDTGKLTEILDDIMSDTASMESDISDHVSALSYLKKYVYGENVLLDTNAYTIGRLVNGVPDTSVQNRVFTSNILAYPYDVTVSVDTGYRIGVAYYDENDDPDGTEPWSTTSVLIRKGTKFRVMIANSPSDTTSNITDVSPYVNAVHCSTYVQDIVNGQQKIKNCTSYSNRLFYAVAHRGYSNTSRPYGDSRLSSYKAAFEAGFNAAECDVQWSSDNVPVCSHDPTFVSNGTTVVIADHTVAELKEYDYFGETIATFEEVLQACKLYGLVLTIDKVSDTWTETQWANIFAIVQRNQMKSGVWWTCPDNTIGARILAYDKYATLIMLGTSGSLNNRLTRANALVTDFNTIVIATDYTGMTIADFISLAGQISNRNIWLGAYVINDADDYMDYMPYVMTITSDRYAPTMLM